MTNLCHPSYCLPRDSEAEVSGCKAALGGSAKAQWRTEEGGKARSTTSGLEQPLFFILSVGAADLQDHAKEENVLTWA